MSSVEGQDMEEENGGSHRFIRGAKRPGADEEENGISQGSRDQEAGCEEKEGERRRTQEGCQAVMSISNMDEQTGREEDEEEDLEHDCEALEQIQSQSCL